MTYSLLSIGEAAAAAAERGFGLEAAPDPDQGARGRVYLRRDLGIGSFGVNAFYQASSGAVLVGEHDELAPGASGHEELYVVLEGSCTFALDGEEVDAPRGTALFVEPATKRSARATADGTIVLVVGGRPGEAFRPGPGEALGPFFRLYREGDYEGALAACRAALESHPGNAMILYNVACLEAALGRADEALAPLAESLAAWPAYRELAAEDADLALLRDDDRFRALVA
jgi:tetratricopeptide (TPR) repeat protein